MPNQKRRFTTVRPFVAFCLLVVLLASGRPLLGEDAAREALSRSSPALAGQDAGFRAEREETEPPPQPLRKLARELRLEGYLSYEYSGRTLWMRADRVYNGRSSGASGTLLLELWATTSRPVFGPTIYAYTLGAYTLGRLPAGSSFTNIDTGPILFTPPPSGTYYITMALLEEQTGEYYYEDFFTFSNQQTFGPGGPGPCPNALCLSSGRFRVELSARDQRTGNTGAGQPIPQSDLFGYFSIPALTRNPDNPEVFVKLLDGRSINGSFWVFYGGLTDLEYTVRVTDTVTGRVKSYFKNPDSACGGYDTGGFSSNGMAPLPAGQVVAEMTTVSDGPEPQVVRRSGMTKLQDLSSSAGRCVPGTNTLCTNNGRFRLTLTARDQRTGIAGPGQAIPQNDIFGYFSIPALTQNPSNPEVFVKVLDGRGANNHFWVFYGGLTDLEYTITVLDMETGNISTYRKNAGSPCGGFDTAFPTGPADIQDRSHIFVAELVNLDNQTVDRQITANESLSQYGSILKTIDAIPNGPRLFQQYLEREVLGYPISLPVKSEDASRLEGLSPTDLITDITNSETYKSLERVFTSVIFSLVPEPASTLIQVANSDTFISLSTYQVRIHITKELANRRIQEDKYTELILINSTNPFEAERQLLTAVNYPIPNWLQPAPRPCLRNCPDVLRPTLTVAPALGTGRGTVTADPSGPTYPARTVVRLIASPNSGSVFVEWKGSRRGTDPEFDVRMDANKTLTPVFNRSADTPKAFLGVGRGGTGTGTVTSSPSGINCGSDCSELYDRNTVVTLTATPDAGSTFASWSGACSGTGACVLTMNADKAVTATFNSPAAGDIPGRYEGDFRTETPSLCAGRTGRWNATVRVENGVLRGVWSDDYHGQNLAIYAQLIGRTATWRVGAGSEETEFSVTFEGAGRVTGTFVGPICTPASGPIRGSFNGMKVPGS